MEPTKKALEGKLVEIKDPIWVSDELKAIKNTGRLVVATEIKVKYYIKRRDLEDPVSLDEYLTRMRPEDANAYIVRENDEKPDHPVISFYNIDWNAS